MTDTLTHSPELLESAADLLRQSRRIAVMAHVNPDADALGSVLGLTLGLRALGMDVRPALSDPVPVYAVFLEGSLEIATEIPADIDAIVCLDSAGIDRVGRLYDEHRDRFDRLPILNLDHHRTNPLYGTVNYVDPVASSTSEVIFRLLCLMDAPIQPATATALLFGIYGDTGSFRNGATTPGSLETAAALLRAGADVQTISFRLFEWMTFAAAQLWGKIVSTVELDRARHIVFAYMTQEMLRETGAAVDEAEGVAEYLRGIEEAETVVLLKENPDGTMRVSFRSRPAIDVASIASRLGGGGHRQAAGCTVAGPVPAAQSTILEAYDALNPL